MYSAVEARIFNPCCCSCDICLDNFAGLSNGTDVSTGTNCGYDEVAGDWSLASNALSITSTYSVLKIAQSTPDNCLVSVSVNSSTTNSHRILFDLVDEDNYLAAEVQRVAGTARYRHRIIRRTAGSETVLVSANEEYQYYTFGALTMTACYNPEDGRLSLHVDGGTFNAFATAYGVSAYDTLSTTAVGLGTGDTCSTAATFDNVNVDRSRGPTESGTCNRCYGCTEGQCAVGVPVAPELEVDVPTLTNSGCSNCADYSGTYVVIQSSFYKQISSGSGCVWRYDFSSPSCSYKHLIIHKSGSTLTAYLCRNPTNWGYFSPVNFTYGDAVIWQTSSAPVDCSGFSELTLDHFANHGDGGAANLCSGIGTTVKVRVA